MFQSATNMGQMFDQTGNFANQGVSLNCWDTSSVTNMAWMFYLQLVLIKIFLNGVFSLLGLSSKQFF